MSNIRQAPRCLFSIIIATISCVLFYAFPVWSADDPTISLVKTIEVREYGDLEISVDEYIVREGDSIAKILQQRGVTGQGPLSKRLLNMIMAFNPEVTDPNLILTGQKMVLPTEPVPDLEKQPLADLPSRPEHYASDTATAPKGARVVSVQEGDTLSKLLRRAGMSNRQIFNEYIELTLKMNPRITNPNLIFAGQQITIPVDGSSIETTATGEATPALTASRPGPGVVSTKTETQTTARTEAKPPRLSVPPPPLPPAESIATRTALGLIFTRIGESYLAKGQHFLPLKTGGQISINTQTYPIIEMRNGQRILLDLDQQLPQEVADMIRTNWSQYTIFRPKHKESLKSMLQRLFETASYYRMSVGGEPWLINYEVQIKAAADWIIWATQEDFVSGRATVITMPSGTNQGTSPEVAQYLSQKGIKVIDYYPKGNLIGPEPRTDANNRPLNLKEISANDHREFIQALLDLVGQKYESDLSIPLMGNESNGQDFNLTASAPIYFTKNSRNYIVAPDGMSVEMIGMLEKQNFNVVARQPGQDAEGFAEKVLQVIGINTESGLTIKASSRPEGHNIEITMPGLLFRSGGSQWLLTGRNVPASLTSLLTEPNLTVVEYTINNPT